MILLPDDLRAQLRANAAARHNVVHHDAMQHGAAQNGGCEPDPLPVVKFFNPVGAATWLATELDSDDDTLFGLADLGFGSPELGSFSLSEIASVRLRFGLIIERDLHFAPCFPMSVYAEASRHMGFIAEDEARLQSAALRLASKFPPSGG